MKKPSYLKWIIEEKDVVLNNGEVITCFKLDYLDDDSVLDEWALHIRQHYISDSELENSCKELEMSPSEYLKSMVIPQKEDPFSGAARSNGISEILFSDLMAFIYGLEVPRCRFDNMSGKTVSEHGADVIGYRFFNDNKCPNNKDRLVTVEVKSGLTEKNADVIERAVIDANKDEYRYAQSLDYMRKKLARMGKISEARDIIRFLKKSVCDYKIEHYAGGISSLKDIPIGNFEGKEFKVIPEIDGTELRLKGKASIYFIHGERLMELAHKIYDRCIK